MKYKNILLKTIFYIFSPFAIFLLFKSTWFLFDIFYESAEKFGKAKIGEDGFGAVITLVSILLILFVVWNETGRFGDE